MDFLIRERDIDTPDTIVSSSSPECIMPDNPIRFPGLRLIDEDDSEDEDKHLRMLKRMSPVIPYISPFVLHPKPQRPTDDAVCLLFLSQTSTISNFQWRKLRSKNPPSNMNGDIFARVFLMYFELILISIIRLSRKIAKELFHQVSFF